MKELYIQWLEKKIGDLLETGECLTESEAYDKASNSDWDEFRDYVADLADALYERARK